MKHQSDGESRTSNILITSLGQEKNMCSSGYPTYPKFAPHTLNIFSKLRSWKRIAILLFSSNFRIWKKNMYQNNHLKQKSKFLCIQSLVLEVKGLKQGYILKIDPFISDLSYLIHFQAGLNIPRKKVFKKNSILQTYPYFFSGCNLNHTYFFI